MQHDHHVSTRIDHLITQISEMLNLNTENHPMTITTGTSHFVSFTAACKYYADYGYDISDVQAKRDAGEIHIGKPDLKPGQKLTVIDSGTRYAIEG